MKSISTIFIRGFYVFLIGLSLVATLSTQAQTCTSPLVSISVTTQNLRCNGDMSGSIGVTVSGGAATVYTYSLYSIVVDPIIVNNYPINNYTFSNLPADDKFFLVIQVPLGGGAFAFCSQSITLTEPPPLAISSAPITNTSCNGGNDGAIDATVTGGPTTPYTYSWSNGATTEDISGLTAGNYTLTIIDGNNCTTSKTFTVSEPAPITSAAAIVDVTCFGKSDGAIALVTSGGTAPYTYLWNTGATTSTLNNIPAGTYTVTYTDSEGCKNSQSFTVAQPSSISALTPPPVITNVICNGDNTGAIDVTTSGGTPAYTFLWSNGTATEDLSGVPAGSYSLTVTDSKGCPTSIGPYVVTENPPIALNSLPTITNVTCNGGNTGAITISPTGGIAPYTYLWSNGATTQNTTALTAGNYSVTITDSKGCSENIGPFTVTEPATITAAYSITDAACNSSATGQITQTSVAGGNPTYSYLWTNGATTANLTNVAAGNYSVTVTDSQGCPRTFGPFTVNEPATITTTPTITNLTCNGGSDGSVALSPPTGGTPNYTYLWSNGSTSPNLTGVPAGSYSVTVTDSKSCTKAFGPFNITEPASVSAVTPPPVITHVICNGSSTGAIDATPSGGTPGYTYLWSNGATTEDLINIPAGNYSLTVTDSKNCKASIGPYTVNQNPPIALTSLPAITHVDCNGTATGAIAINPTGGNAPYTYLWNNGATTQNISGVAAGNYSVTITDNTSCSKTFGPYTINEQPAITATTVITDASCNGAATGSIILTPAGGTAGYTYLWSNGTATKDLTNVAAGSYSLTITDSKSCTKALGPFTINEPVPIAATGTITNVACHGGATGAIAITMPTGGTLPYTYAWSNGATTKDLASLIAGTYTLTIKDASGCSITLPVFTITEPTAIAATNTITNISCSGGATGAIDVTTTGGTTPYTFSWSNGALTEDLTAVAAGNYTLTITDSKGCTRVIGPLTISQNPPIALTSLPAITHVDCNGTATGAISINPTGGSVPYTYLWSNGATTQNISAVTAGNYSVTITDNTSCSKTFGPYTINTQPPVTAATVITDASCNGTATGSIVLTPAGGTAGYTYLWSNGATTKDLTNVIAGSYTLTITDSKSCTKALGPYTINQPVPIAATGTIVNVACHGGATGSITISTPTGGTLPYTYAWTNGAVTKDLAGLIAGTYTLTIKDASGCSTTLPAFIVTEPTAISSVGAVTHVVCNGTSTGGINISTPTGGVGPYSYLWSDGKTSQNNPSLPAGTYSVTITDASACTLILPFTITEPIAIATTETITNVSCNGASNGSIALSAPTGGTAPYSYTWSNGVTTQNNPAIAAGSYSVVISDNNGCSKTFGPFNVTEPTTTITATGTTVSPSCNGSASGSITLGTITGGTPAYTYLWSNGAITQSLTNVVAGDYSVTITDSKGCSTLTPVSFTIAPGPSISGTASAVPATICSGQGTTVTASIDAAYTPAANAYSFNGGTTFQASPTFTISTITADTIITVVIKDINGCLSDPIAVSIQTNKIAGGVLSITKEIDCFGNSTGELTMTIPGNPPMLTYSINGSIFQPSNVFSNLPAGSYTIVVDNGGTCNSSYTATLTEPVVLTIGIKTITDVNACISPNNGSIAVTANGGNGGTAGRTFTISPSGLSQTDSLFTNLTADTYTITVTDTKGCTAVVNGTVNSSTPITVTSTNTNVNCTNPLSGSINVSVAGGAAPYTYFWNDGSTNQDLLNLSADTYKVIVTDSKGCKDSLTVSITNTPPITGTATASPATVCSGQSSTITAVFDAAYTPAASGYSFNDGLTFQTASTFSITSILADTIVHVVLKDINSCLSNTIDISIATSKINATVDVSKQVSCNGGNDGEITVTAAGNTSGYTYSINGGAFQTSPVFPNLAAGTHTVIINDGSACNSSYTATLKEPSAITIAVASTVDINPCAGGNNGSITVTSTGGNGGNIFTITPSGSTQTSLSFTGLTAGTYTIRVDDSKNCSATTTATLIEPAGLDTAAIIPVIKNNPCPKDLKGSIQLSYIPGGISSYTYTLNGVTNNTSVFDLLLSNDYKMIITDKNNCKTDYLFTITNPASIEYTASATPSSCNTPDGSIEIMNVTGGKPPYKYSINDGTTYLPTAIFTGLAANVYHVRVSDNDCSTSKDVSVTTKTAPVPYIRIQQPTCNSGGNGFFVVDSVHGGEPLFQYELDHTPRGSTTVYSDLKAGSYILTISDQACTYDIDSFYVYNETTLVYDTISAPKITITEPKPITGQVFSVDADRYENSGVAIIHEIRGGKPGYSWSADNITYTPVVRDTIFLNYLSRGNHKIYVQDTNGCLGTFDITIHVQFFIPNLITPNKDGKNDRFEIMALPVGSELKIVNRWGNQVYISENYDNSWDADQDSDGIYYYELKLPNGDRHKGWLEVIR